MSDEATTHHAAPIRAMKIRGVDYVAVDDMATMFTEMAQNMPDAKLAQVLGVLVEAMGARPPEANDLPKPTSRPCPGCGVRVESYASQDETDPEILLNARPVPHGRWMVTRTATRWLAVPYDDRKHHSLNVARYREHACSGPFGGPAR